MKQAASIFTVLIALVLIGCMKKPNPAPAAEEKRPTASVPVDACAVFTAEDVQAAQGSPVKNTKSNATSSAGLRTTQCYYATEQPNNSVSVTITQIDPAGSSGRTPNDYWEQIFGRFEKEQGKDNPEREKEEAKEQEHARGPSNQPEEEEGVPPTKIPGIGDEAFWLGNRVGGAFYAIDKKKNAFVRISLGGSANAETKIERSKKLAQKALNRL